MSLNTLWWRSYWANTAFLVCIFAASTWTGGEEGVAGAPSEDAAVVGHRLYAPVKAWAEPACCPTPLLPALPSAATFYFDHFAHRYVAGLGLAPRRRTTGGSATPSISTASDAKKRG